MIKVLMPEKIQKVADVLSKVGYQKEVDEFILSMNRAAEKAAPKAASFFVGAIKEMSIDDARGILNGGDTAATEFFRKKTHDQIYEAFKPIISTSMDEVGATRSYKNMMSKYESIPLWTNSLLIWTTMSRTSHLMGFFIWLDRKKKRSALTLLHG